MKIYNYYWYHHMMPKKEREKIESALFNKDYFSFIELYKKYSIQAIKYGNYIEELEVWCPMVYLPDGISVWDDDTYIETISILDKNNFEKITFSECECG